MLITAVRAFVSRSGYIAVFIVPSTWSFYLTSVLLGVGAACKCLRRGLSYNIWPNTKSLLLFITLTLKAQEHFQISPVGTR